MVAQARTTGQLEHASIEPVEAHLLPPLSFEPQIEIGIARMTPMARGL